MSISTAIIELSARIQDAYTALSSKGASIPNVKNSYNLSSTIDTIQIDDGNLAYFIDGTLSSGLTLYNENVQVIRYYGLAYLWDTYEEINLPNAIGIAGSISTPTTSALTANIYTSFNRSKGIKRLILPKFKNTATGWQKTLLTGTNYLTACDHLDLRSCTGVPTTTASDQRIFGRANISSIAYGLNTCTSYEFANATGLKELILPNCYAIKTDTALSGCTALSSLTMQIPVKLNSGTVFDTNLNAFSTCINLKNVCLSGHNASYEIFYSTTGGELAQLFPYVETMTIDDYGSTNSFCAFNALSGSTTLKHLIIFGNRYNGTTIGADDATQLEQIDISCHSEYISRIFYDRSSFKNCPKLKLINIHGDCKSTTLFMVNNQYDVLSGVTSCHIWFFDDTGSFVNSLLTSFLNISQTADTFDHSNVIHFMQRNTRVTWSNAQSMWVEEDDMEL